MEKYSSYKDSGVKWLGEIPSHWTLLPGLAVMKENKEKNSNLEYNTVLSLSYGKIIIKKDINEGLVPAEYNTYQIVKSGYIVIRCTDLQNDKTSLRTGLVKNEGIITSAYLGLVIDAQNNPSYIHYFLHAWDITKELYRHGSGLRQSLSWLDLKRLPILIPSRTEQDAIVSYLDTVTTQIDTAIFQQQKMIELLNERKQIIINNAVTKGLDPNVKMKDSGVDWIGDIPEGWEVRPIKHFKSKEKNAFVDGPFGSNLKSEHYVENGDVYVIESGMVTTGKFVKKDFKSITFSHFKTIERSECKPGDVIIAKIGAKFGMAAELPDLGKRCVVSGNSLKLSLDQKLMINSLFVCYMGLAKIRNGFIGLYQETAQPALSLGGLNNMLFPVPPLNEQIKISQYLDTKISKIDAIVTIFEKQITLLQERKQIIINEVVTGKVKVV